METSQMKYRHLSYSFLAILAFTACSSNNDLHDHPNLKTGKQLFDFHCASCHSKDGHGQFLKGIPSNRDTELSTQKIITFIRKNGDDNKRTMPVFSSMGSKEARKIAIHLLDLKRQAEGKK